MKRSEALQPLSHDHHQALFIAQRLRRADEDSASEAAAAFLDFWREHGRRHFRDEEEILLPAFAAYGDPADPLVARVLTDHVAIRHRADRLERAAGEAQSLQADNVESITSAAGAAGEEMPAAGSPGDLHEVGTMLADHVRREERELFPMIEAAMPEDAAAELASIFVAAEQGRNCST